MGAEGLAGEVMLKALLWAASMWEVVSEPQIWKAMYEIWLAVTEVCLGWEKGGIYEC